MSRATNAYVTRDAIEGIAWEMRFETEKVEPFLDYAIAEGLIYLQNELYTAQRVKEDQQKLALARKTSKERQAKARESRVTGGEKTRDSDPAPVTVPEDLNLNSNKEGFSEDPITGMVYPNRWKAEHEPAPNPKAQHEVDLPCIKLVTDDWNALVMNHFHGNKDAAAQICEAASDYLQAKGEPVPADCMAYLRGWIRKGKQFERAKPKPKNGISENGFGANHLQNLKNLDELFDENGELRNA